MAPSFMAAKCSPRMTWTLPVKVTKQSPSGAASAIGMTSKPSIRASSAGSGSTSVTITWAPAPRARIAKPAAAPAVARDHHGAPGQQHVGGAHDAVERGLPGAVAVVEHVLGVRVVDRDDRELEHALLRHRLEADDAGGGLLGRARARWRPAPSAPPAQRLDPAADRRRQVVQPVERDHVQRADQIGAVVLGHVRAEGQRAARCGCSRSRGPRP